MKRITLVLVVTFLLSGLTVYSQKVTSGAVVGITQVKPATGVSNEQFETFYFEEFFPVFNKSFSSIPISLMKMIKGKRMGEYAEFYVFESLKGRNRWWPKPGVPSEEAKKAFENMGEIWSKWRELVSSLEFTDYVVLPFSGTIDVKPGNVVAIFECDFTLEEGMTFEDLEQLYQKEYGPSIMKNFQGTQFCVFKGERGDRTGKYTEMIVFKSLEEYNKWFMEDGMLSEKAKQAFENMREIQDRMEKMYSYNTATYYIVL
jgi:hypothetical protein